jgi:L-fucose isomerase-like protein
MNDKSTFALFFGNRGFFPASLIVQARDELPRALKEMGHDTLLLDETATHYGAVETTREGEVYANFLRQNRGKYDGVILSLPNFGDETGAVAALKEADVPILIQAYPDDMDELSPALRRDAFCGKLSIADVFRQYGVKFTTLKPHVVKPTSDRFKANIDYFDRVCRVVKGLRNMVVGAIGARTTPFKTVRIDELALQRYGITVETLDMADVIGRVNAMNGSAAYRAKAQQLRAVASWDGVPEPAFDHLTKLGVVLDEIIDEYQMDAVAIRCWLELQQQLGISPCVVLGSLNDQNIGAACEVDIGSAIALQALNLASGEAATCLDWNNNYEDEDDKCILFHCGPVPASLMAQPGRITDHDILINAVGEGLSFGCNVGRIAQFDFTFGNVLTEEGRLRWYLGHGEFTNDTIPPEFFGCAGVAHVENLQDVLMHVMRAGHRHHVNLTPGNHAYALKEALHSYLDHDVALPQEEAARAGAR